MNTLDDRPGLVATGVREDGRSARTPQRSLSVLLGCGVSGRQQKNPQQNKDCDLGRESSNAAHRVFPSVRARLPTHPLEPGKAAWRRQSLLVPEPR
jgi:hypothetical protein